MRWAGLPSTDGGQSSSRPVASASPFRCFADFVTLDRVETSAGCVCSLDRGKSGRKRKTTAASRNRIALRLDTGKASVYGAALQHNPPLSPPTVRRVAREKGLRYLSCVPTPILTPDHRRRRVRFAKFHLANKTDFRKVPQGCCCVAAVVSFWFTSALLCCSVVSFWFTSALLCCSVVSGWLICGRAWRGRPGPDRGSLPFPFAVGGVLR